MPIVSNVWNGSSWSNPFFLVPNVSTGSQWLPATPKIWDGTGWVSLVGLPTNYTVSVYTVYSPASAIATFNTDGSITGAGTWISTTAVTASNYEVYVTSSSSLTTNSGLNTWINLSTSPSWGITVNGSYAVATIQVYVRHVGDQTPAQSKIITLIADSSYPSLPY